MPEEKHIERAFRIIETGRPQGDIEKLVTKINTTARKFHKSKNKRIQAEITVKLYRLLEERGVIEREALPKTNLENVERFLEKPDGSAWSMSLIHLRLEAND